MSCSTAVYLILIWALLLFVTSAQLPPVSASESYVSFSDSNKKGSKLSESPSTGIAVDDLMLPFQAGISSSTDSSVVDGSTQVSSDQQLTMVIDTLRRAGTYNVMAEALSALGLRVLPHGSTLFVPTDEALSVIQRSSVLVSLVQYHISLLQLRFPQLLGLNVGTRISTLLPNKTIVITSNSMLEYRINNVLVSYPDMYNDAAASVHGIEGIFNATLYGHGDPSILADHQNTAHANVSTNSTVSMVASPPAAPTDLPISGAPTAAIISTPKAAAAATVVPQPSATLAPAPEEQSRQKERALPPIGLLTPPDLQEILFGAGFCTTAKHEAVTFIISSSLMLNMCIISMFI